jgi:putative oxidoreductase
MSTTATRAVVEKSRSSVALLDYAAPLGRILYSLIFIFSMASHFRPQYVGYAASQGVPLASLAVPLSGMIAGLGGLSIALGYRAKLGAWLIVLFLVPVTLTMHRFWGLSDPQVAQLQLGMFMKNVSMLGAALLIARVGSGPLSLRND